MCKGPVAGRNRQYERLARLEHRNERKEAHRVGQLAGSGQEIAVHCYASE